MSSVTNLILSTLVEEDGQLAADFLEERYPGTLLLELPDAAAGGNKCLEVCLRVGAYNYLDLGGLLRAMSLMPFQHPECVQLFVQEQDDDLFTERFQATRSEKDGE